MFQILWILFFQRFQMPSEYLRIFFFNYTLANNYSSLSFPAQNFTLFPKKTKQNLKNCFKLCILILGKLCENGTLKIIPGCLTELADGQQCQAIFRLPVVSVVTTFNHLLPIPGYSYLVQVVNIHLPGI